MRCLYYIAIILFIIMSLVGCKESNDGREIKPPLEPRFSKTNDCIAFAKIALDGFDENNFIATEDNSTTSTLNIEFEWQDKDNKKQRLDCYFKKIVTNTN